MEYKLQDLIDIEQFQALQDRLNEIYSFPSAIIDNEGNILTATAWQDVCTKFHRTNKESEKECIKSDQYIFSHLYEANPAVSYRCPHGLVDNATPIIIDGIHYGNFFTGQFFLEKPDLEFFKEQAKKYGFDEEAYLEAVKKVPVWSEEQLNSYLFFIKGLIEVISSSGLKKLQEIEARKKIEETEERAGTIINQMQDGFWIASGKYGQVVDVNPAMCAMLGYTREELLNMSVADVEAVDSPEDIKERIEKIVRDGSASFQSRHKRKDGTLIDVEVSVTYLPSSNLFFAIHRDVTERSQAEKQLSDSEQRFRSIFEQAPIGMGLIESHTNKFLQVNSKYCEIVGRTKDEMLNTDFHMITHPDDIGIDLKNKQKLLDGEIRSYELDKRYIKPDQSIVWAHLTIVAMWEGDDGPKYHLTMVEDITERKVADEKLRESEKKYRDLINGMNDAAWVIDFDTTILDVNNTACAVLGYTREELLSMKVSEIDLDLTPEQIHNLANTMPDDKVQVFETYHTTKDGRKLPVEVSSSLVSYAGKTVIMSISRDITERKRVEDALRESEERLQLFVDHAPASLAMFDRKMRYLAVSRRWLSDYSLGDQDIIGRSHYDIFPEISDEWKAVHQRGMKGEVIRAENDKFVREDGSVQWLMWEVRPWHANDGSVGGIVIFTEDITERKHTEEALLESEQRFHQMFEKHNAVMLLIEPASGNIIDANIAAQEFYGYSIDTLTQMKIQDINVLPAEEVAAHRRQASMETLNFFEFPHRLASGDVRTVEVHSSPIDVQGKRILFSVMHDITDKKRTDQKVQEHLMRLEALRKIDQAISSSFDLNISLNILLSYAVRLLEVDAATVLKLNHDLNTLEYITGIGFKTDDVKNSSVRLGQSFAGKAALYQQVIKVQNIAEEPDNVFTSGFLKDEDFVSYYGAPLVIKGKVIGVLEVFGRSNIERTKEWFDFFNALAGQAGIAIDNLTLFTGLQNSNLELLMAYDATIEGWSRAMDLRDEETEGHTRRVTDLTMKLAEQMGIERSKWVHIRRGALLHDIGKLGVPDHILRKPGELTDEEWNIMRKHPVHAMEMLMPISYLRSAIDIPYCHHEWWDGSGYPRGLRGEQIPLAARLFAIIDVWDALRSNRPYRSAWTEEKTLEYIKSQAGTHFDPDVVDAFFELIGEKRSS